MMAAIVYTTIRLTSHDMQRVQWANKQLEAITALTVNANRYSEQIAEFLLIGEPERPDYDSARAELEAGFDELDKLTRGEAEFLVGSSEPEDGHRGSDRGMEGKMPRPAKERRHPNSGIARCLTSSTQLTRRPSTSGCRAAPCRSYCANTRSIAVPAAASC
jgi:hypothetical protein